VNELATAAALMVILALALTIDLLWKRTRSRRITAPHSPDVKRRWGLFTANFEVHSVSTEHIL
jgi:hypothetical protein